MDAHGNIYELNDEQKAWLSRSRDEEMMTETVEEQVAVLREDVARLDGFLRGRAESDRRSHEKLVWDSAKDGTYRKNHP